MSNNVKVYYDPNCRLCYNAVNFAKKNDKKKRKITNKRSLFFNMMSFILFFENKLITIKIFLKTYKDLLQMLNYMIYRNVIANTQDIGFLEENLVKMK